MTVCKHSLKCSFQAFTILPQMKNVTIIRKCTKKIFKKGRANTSFLFPPFLLSVLKRKSTEKWEGQERDRWRRLCLLDGLVKKGSRQILAQKAELDTSRQNSREMVVKGVFKVTQTGINQSGKLWRQVCHQGMTKWNVIFTKYPTLNKDIFCKSWLGILKFLTSFSIVFCCWKVWITLNMAV